MNLKSVIKLQLNEDDIMNDKRFDNITKNILAVIGKEETNRLFHYELCELAPNFIAFVNNYADLKDKIPKDYTIIDVGCYQAFQGALYKNHAKYIGIEPCVPIKNRLRQSNAEYYNTTFQEFKSNILPYLIKKGLDLNKTLAVCSAVPDSEARNLVKQTFKYYRIAYPGLKTYENLPTL